MSHWREVTSEVCRITKWPSREVGLLPEKSGGTLCFLPLLRSQGFSEEARSHLTQRFSQSRLLSTKTAGAEEPLFKSPRAEGRMIFSKREEQSKGSDPRAPCKVPWLQPSPFYPGFVQILPSVTGGLQVTSSIDPFQALILFRR